MNDKEIIARLEEVINCDINTCPICNGWLKKILEAIKRKEE